MYKERFKSHILFFHMEYFCHEWDDLGDFTLGMVKRITKYKHRAKSFALVVLAGGRRLQLALVTTTPILH